MRKSDTVSGKLEFLGSSKKYPLVVSRHLRQTQRIHPMMFNQTQSRIYEIKVDWTFFSNSWGLYWEESRKVIKLGVPSRFSPFLEKHLSVKTVIL